MRVRRENDLALFRLTTVCVLSRLVCLPLTLCALSLRYPLDCIYVYDLFFLAWVAIRRP